MLAIVGALWSLEHLYSPTPRGLRTWESGVQEKPMTSWRLQGMRHKTHMSCGPKGIVLPKALRECLRGSLRAACAPAVLAYARE